MIMAANQLLNISRPQAINVTGSLAPRIVRKARSNTEHNQGLATSQPNGTAPQVEEQPAAWSAKASESSSAAEKPLRRASLVLSSSPISEIG